MENLSGDPLKGRILALATNKVGKTRLGRLSRDKHSSILRKFVTNSRKKFHDIDPRGLYHKTLRIRNLLEMDRSRNKL